MLHAMLFLNRVSLMAHRFVHTSARLRYSFAESSKSDYRQELKDRQKQAAEDRRRELEDGRLAPDNNGNVFDVSDEITPSSSDSTDSDKSFTSLGNSTTNTSLASLISFSLSDVLGDENLSLPSSKIKNSDCRNCGRCNNNTLSCRVNAQETQENGAIDSSYTSSLAPPPPPKSYFQEYNYLHLIQRILNEGELRNNRTNVQTLSLFGEQLSFDLSTGKFPLFTIRRLFFKGIVEELLWFLRGSTDTDDLLSRGVNIWNANASREFLDSRGLTNYEVGELGPVYGYQWRHFGARYIPRCSRSINSVRRAIEENNQEPLVMPDNDINGNDISISGINTNAHKNKNISGLNRSTAPVLKSMDTKNIDESSSKQQHELVVDPRIKLDDLSPNTIYGFDQIAEIVRQLKEDPSSRRIILSAWNPPDLAKMALPPCHVLAQFFVSSVPPNDAIAENVNCTGKLSCVVYQRSCDVALGLPFNVASYALLTAMLAHTCGMSLGTLKFFLGDTHVYVNQIEKLRELLNRQLVSDFPTLEIARRPQDVIDLSDYTFNDFILRDYNPHNRLDIPFTA